MRGCAGVLRSSSSPVAAARAFARPLPLAAAWAANDSSFPLAGNRARKAAARPLPLAAAHAFARALPLAAALAFAAALVRPRLPPPLDRRRLLRRLVQRARVQLRRRGLRYADTLPCCLPPLLDRRRLLRRLVQRARVQLRRRGLQLALPLAAARAFDRALLWRRRSPSVAARVAAGGAARLRTYRTRTAAHAGGALHDAAGHLSSLQWRLAR